MGFSPWILGKLLGAPLERHPNRLAESSKKATTGQCRRSPIVGSGPTRTALRIGTEGQKGGHYETLSKGYVPSDGTLRCSSACSTSANTTRANATAQTRQRHRPNKAPTLKLAVRQRVPQSEPWAATRPRARSSEQATAVARRGERSERTSDTKGTGVRLLNHLTFDVGARPPFLAQVRCGQGFRPAMALLKRGSFQFSFVLG